MDSLLPRIGLALAIGLLVGLERGWRERDEPAGSRTAGIRTYGISGLLGGVLAALAQAFGAPSIFLAGMLGFVLVFGWFKFEEGRHDGNFSVTGVVAAICVLALGGLAVVGDHRGAAGAGAALAALLASREAMHGALRQITWIELRSAIVLAVMTVIVLPLLPNRTIDPWGGLNPWEIWLFTVLTAAISFMGYIAIRILGAARGLLVSALAGALVSSTAVTLAFARTAHQSTSTRSLSGAAALAAMVSILRVTVVVALLQPQVLPAMAPPALAAAGVFAASGLLLLFHGSREAASSPARNPFALGGLLLFAALFALVATANAALVGRFGGGSLLGASALSGTFDVDVAVLSALRLAGQGLPDATIGQAVLAALCANGLGRLALAIPAGPVAFWLPLVVATAGALGAGFAVFLVTGLG